MQKSTNELTDKKTRNTSKTQVAKKASSTDKPKKKATTKESTTAKSTSTKSTLAKKTSTKKTVPTKKVATQKTVANKSTTKRKTSSKKVEIIEYYDLPYRYNQTVVRILAQTPTTLFVYWDISDDDREKYVNKFGKDFFENTVPILIIHNKTMNYSFEIEINDFANSWYFTVSDASCNYEIELGRRTKQPTFEIPNNYIPIAYSNSIEAPNNHILFEKSYRTLFFRNIKTGVKTSKDISKFEFMKYVDKIYNIYDLYKKMYKDDELQDLEKNPSSTF